MSSFGNARSRLSPQISSNQCARLLPSKTAVLFLVFCHFVALSRVVNGFQKHISDGHDTVLECESGDLSVSKTASRPNPTASIWMRNLCQDRLVTIQVGFVILQIDSNKQSESELKEGSINDQSIILPKDY